MQSVMMPSQTLILEFPSLKRTQRYGAKVRTGCLTCKSRRVKCDEAKPACVRCTSTRRVCDGYIKSETTQPKRLSPSAGSAFLDTPVSQPWPEDGLLYLEFYYHCAIQTLSNHFDNGFWSRTVLQLARSEPCIRHALVTLGYLFKLEPGNLKHALTRLTQQDRTFSLHYVKAIGLLVERIDEQSCTIELGLVACLLFVCIEFIRGDFMTGFAHLHSGVKILCGLPSTRINGLRPRTPPPTSPRRDTIQFTESNSLLKETLIPMFMRNITYAMLFSDSIEDTFEISIPNPTSYDSPFLTFHELQMSSFQLRNASALFARNMAIKIFLKEPFKAEDLARQSQLLEAHCAWHKALQKLEHAACLKHEEEIMAATLKMGYYNTYIMVNCAMDAMHTSFDAHLSYFKAINHNAGIVLNSMGIATPPLPVSSGAQRGILRKNIVGLNRASGSKNTQKAGAHFTFEISLIPSLHFVATRCRCPFVRREAVALLKTNPPREGFWDAETHITIANRVVEIEEMNLDPSTGWPAASSRLNCSFPSGRANSDGKITVTFAFSEWGLA